MRIPRGISSGNTRDFGLYDQCLGIHEVVDDMNIEGKHCLIGVPANQNVNPDDDDDDPEYMKWNFNPNMLKLNYTKLNNLGKNRRHKKIDNAIGLVYCKLYLNVTVAGITFTLDTMEPHQWRAPALSIPRMDGIC